MLTSMRKGIDSWVVKALLFLLVGSFGLWGVGDIFRGATDVTLAVIGSDKITGGRFLPVFQNRLQSLQAQQGSNVLTTELARSLGLDQQVLQQIIARSAFDQHLNDLKLAADRPDVAARIRALPVFQNEFGSFDRLKYNSLLMASGAQAKFEADAASELMSDQLLATLAEGMAPPKLMIDQLYRFRGEKRDIRLATIPYAKMTVPEPTEAELEAYHRDNPRNFTAPEYRALTYLTISPDDLLSEVEVSEEDLVEAYEFRKQEFTVEELRDVDQMVLLDQDAADAAHRRLVQGADFAALARELTGASEEDIALGQNPRGGFLPEAVDAIFGATEGAVTEPRQSPFGWHLYRINKVFAGAVLTFDETRERLRRDVALERARDSLYGLYTSIEDELGGGATLEEAGSRLALRIFKIDAVDANGLDPAGAKPAALPDHPDFLTSAFTMEPGLEEDLPEIESGALYFVRVDRVTPSAVRPLSTVRGPVTDAWRTTARVEAAEKAAQTMAGKIRLGADMDESAKGYEVRVVRSLARDGRNRGPYLSAPTVAALFDLGVGQTISGVAGNGVSAVVATVMNITGAELAAEDDGRARVESQLGTAAQADLVDQYQRALFRDMGMETNLAGLDILFEGSAIQSSLPR